MAPVTEGAYTLSFVRGAGREFSAILTFPGPRGALYPIIGYARLVEFRAMLAALAADHRTGDWTGSAFFADIIASDQNGPPEIWFRAHDNGIRHETSRAAGLAAGSRDPDSWCICLQRQSGRSCW